MSKQQEPMIESWITPSQKRIFSGDRKQPSIEKLTCMKNEPISFGLAFRSDYQKTPEEKRKFWFFLIKFYNISVLIHNIASVIVLVIFSFFVFY